MEESGITVSLFEPVKTRTLLPHGVFLVQPAIKFHPCLKSLIISSEVGCNYNHSRCFCNCEICFPKCPNSVWFHTYNLARQELMHERIGNGDSEPTPSPYASVIDTQKNFKKYIESAITNKYAK